MAKSVKDLPSEIQELIDVYEWDMRTLEGNKRFKDLRATSLPSIALDEALEYESLIPGQEEISTEITKRWVLKNNLDTG